MTRTLHLQKTQRDELTNHSPADLDRLLFAARAGVPPHEPRSADFQSAVSPISNRQPCESCSALYYSKVSQAGSPATSPESFRGTQIGNLRYSGEAVQTFKARNFLWRNSLPEGERWGEGEERVRIDCVQKLRLAFIVLILPLLFL